MGPVMDIYNAWFDLKPGVSDMELSDRLPASLDNLKNDGLMQGWRLTRRKLGLSAAPVGEFHLMMEFTGMAQLDQAFGRVGSRREPIETVHFGVNSLVQNVQFALYRDFPDSMRHRGEEKCGVRTKMRRDSNTDHRNPFGSGCFGYGLIERRQ